MVEWSYTSILIGPNMQFTVQISSNPPTTAQLPWDLWSTLLSILGLTFGHCGSCLNDIPELPDILKSAPKVQSKVMEMEACNIFNEVYFTIWQYRYMTDISQNISLRANMRQKSLHQFFKRAASLYKSQHSEMGGSVKGHIALRSSIGLEHAIRKHG